MSPKTGDDGMFDEYAYIQLTKDVRVVNCETDGEPLMRSIYIRHADTFGNEYYEWFSGDDALGRVDADKINDAIDKLALLIPRKAWVSYKEDAPVIEISVAKDD